MTAVDRLTFSFSFILKIESCAQSVFFQDQKTINFKDGDNGDNGFRINSESNGFEIIQCPCSGSNEKGGPCVNGNCRINTDECKVNDDNKDCVASPWESKKGNLFFIVNK